MKRIYYEGKNNFYFKEIAERECSSDEVEIKPLVLGLCGSDLHKFLKQSPNNNYLLTHVLGHEISGKVTNVGDSVKHVKIGDTVVVNPFNIPSDIKTCESYSLIGNQIGIVGRTIDGGYSEIIYLPKNCVYKLPDEISTEDAIFIDDIAVAVHGIHYIDEYKKELDSLAVIGDGPLGILIYRILKNKFPTKSIVLFARNLSKLDKKNINAIDYSEIGKYKESFDVILEAVGGEQSDTLNNAILIGKPNFLVLCYGVFNFNYMADIDVRMLFYKQGMLKGINSYCNRYNDFEIAIKLLEEKKIEVNDLITSKIDFENSIEFIKNYKHTTNNIKSIFKLN